MLFPGYLIGGRYRLVRQLGEGGMGVVWSAVNEAFGREVAIKVMLPSVASDAQAIERFFTEARICGGIRHPGIVDVLDVGRLESGAPYLVMELLNGDSIDKVLERTETLQPLEILPVVRDIARTLALAHEKGVIHRDIKPGNIFLHRLPTGQVVAKVLDFGVSKVTNPVGPTTQTRVGTVVGSPAYMSPEQAGGKVEVDARSDIWALGVILYESLTGRLPYEEENFNALMIDIAVREPPLLSAAAPHLPKPVTELVKAAMAHKREDRIQDGNELADRIDAVIHALGASRSIPLPDPANLEANGSGGGSRPMSQTSSALSSNAGIRTRRSSPLIAIAAVLVGGAIAAAVWMTRGSSSGSSSSGAAQASNAVTGPSATKSTAAPSATAEALPTATEVAPTVTPTTSAVAPSTAAPSSVAPSSTGPRAPVKGPPKKTGVWTYD